MKQIHKMKKLFLFLVLVFSFSCSNNKTTISDFAWLNGKWIGSSQGMNFFEEWQSTKHDLLNGFGGAISGTDTVFSEKIQIEQRGSDIFYTANVQENGGPVDFKFIGYKNDSIVFENSVHDYPQRVVYFRLPDNKLYACIDGLKAGKYARLEFFYQQGK